MVFSLHRAGSSIEELRIDLKEANVRAVADREMERILKEEFLPFLTERIENEHDLVGEGPDRGPGPRLSDTDAWTVNRRGNMDYKVKTIPVVSERAYYLEFGTAAPITPGEDSETMRFRSTEGPTAGDIIYPTEVDGVKAYRFASSAATHFDALRILDDNVSDEVSQHLRKILSIPGR